MTEKAIVGGFDAVNFKFFFANPHDKYRVLPTFQSKVRQIGNTAFFLQLSDFSQINI